MKKRRITYTAKTPVPALEKAWFQLTDIANCPKTINEYLHQFINCTSALCTIPEGKLNQVRIDPLKEGVEVILKKVERDLSFIVAMTSIVEDNLVYYSIDTSLSKKFSTMSSKYKIMWNISIDGLKLFNYNGFEVSAAAVCSVYKELDTQFFWAREDLYVPITSEEMYLHVN